MRDATPQERPTSGIYARRDDDRLSFRYCAGSAMDGNGRNPASCIAEPWNQWRRAVMPMWVGGRPACNEALQAGHLLHRLTYGGQWL